VKRAAFTGWLVKRGAVNKGSWKRRFFALDGRLLFYFSTDAAPGASDCVGVILLEGVRAALPEGDGSSAKPPPELAPGHPAGAIFGLVLGSGRVVALVAGSASERTQWIGAIEQTLRPTARIDAAASALNLQMQDALASAGPSALNLNLAPAPSPPPLNSVSSGSHEAAGRLVRHQSTTSAPTTSSASAESRAQVADAAQAAEVEQRARWALTIEVSAMT
jgi:hypothetical protein